MNYKEERLSDLKQELELHKNYCELLEKEIAKLEAELVKTDKE